MIEVYTCTEPWHGGLLTHLWDAEACIVCEGVEDFLEQVKINADLLFSVYHTVLPKFLVGVVQRG